MSNKPIPITYSTTSYDKVIVIYFKNGLSQGLSRNDITQLWEGRGVIRVEPGAVTEGRERV